MTIEKFLIIVKIIMVLASVIVLLSFLYFKKRAIEIKLIGFNFLSPVVGYFSIDLLDLRGMQVNIPQNIEMLVHFVIITIMYYLALQKRYPKVFLTLLIVFSIFAIVNMLFLQKTYFNSYTVTISNVIAIAYCVAYFYRLLIDLPAQHLQRLPMFWFSAGFLMQAAGALFLYLFTAYLTKFFFDDVLIYWTFHNFLNIFLEILILIGVVVDLRNTRPRRVAVMKNL
ncbi:hypothetical protein SAMN04488109_6467 [Chryseolinea serpens]|uniref:YhhN-like protein n=1 Tax=Chryseolinea serpens TaxID=947013 RepID=A0A1M5XEY2_9BACT|nr:hypothetical protein [Chryseolinea serpens]SHH98309.1 hypothetical protein SAMN04488109_6467 [Chryseolinea serpens]